MAGALDRDYAKSRAVLIGTWEYTHLTGPLPAVENSLDRMTTLLTGELCGWPDERLTVIRNQREPGTLPDQLVETFDGVEDVALFYYVGHGQSDSDNKLCLGLVDTRGESSRRATTSLQFEDVRRALLHCAARTKIVILDCCFAGLAIRTEGVLATKPDVAELAGGTGAFTMAASGYSTLAQFEEEGPHPQTYFTKGLADIVETHGLPGEPSGLKLGPIFNRLRNELRNANRPEPTALNRDSAAEFVFARNVIKLTQSTVAQEPALVRSDPLVTRPLHEIVGALPKMLPVDAVELLTSVADRRSGQEIAALVDLLRKAEDDPSANAIIHIATAQPAAKIVELLSALYALGLREDTSALVTEARLPELVAALWPVDEDKRPAEPLLEWFLNGVAHGGAASVAAVVDALNQRDEPDRARTLVKLAVHARPKVPELADLLATLWPVLRPDPITALLPIEDPLPLVDALRHNGWPVDANQLLTTVTDRPNDRIAATVMTLVSAGRHTELGHLLHAVTNRRRQPYGPSVMAFLASQDADEVARCMTAFLRVGGPHASTLLDEVVSRRDMATVVRMLLQLGSAVRDLLIARLAAGRYRWLYSALVEELVRGGQMKMAELLLEKLAKADTAEWTAVSARVATEQRRIGWYPSAAKLNDRVRPGWRMDRLRAAPYALFSQVVAVLLIRAYFETVSRPDAGLWTFVAGAVSIAVLVTIMVTVGVLTGPTSFISMLRETADPPAATWVLGGLVVAGIGAGLVRADWFVVGVVCVGVLVAMSATSFWYDIDRRPTVAFLSFTVVCGTLSVLSPGWSGFLVVLAVAALWTSTAFLKSHIRELWLLWTGLIAVGGILQWSLSAPWLTSVAKSIGQVLSWGL